jgi:hypothetical protein
MACSCVTGLGNTGVPSCLPINEIPVGFIFQETYDSTGTRNFLSGTSIGNADYLNGLTQSTDATVKLFPVQDIAEAVSERGDSTFYTDSLGVEHFIKEGERTFVGEKVTSVSPKLVGKIDTMKCNQMSVYVVGHLGGIFGISTTSGELQGFEIVKGSMDLRWVWGTASKPAHIPMKFTLADTVNDSEIMKFENAEIEDNAKSLSGMLDVDGTVDGTVTTSTFTVDLALEYGTAKTLTAVEGLVLADFVLTEISPTPGVSTISGVTESSAGKYVFTATTTSADVNELTLSATGIAKGYDMDAVTITTP